MPRFFGHKAGVDALVRTVLSCADRGVEYLTVFAFSSENWKRPTEEVSGLMGLVLVAVAKYLGKLADKGVRIRIVGDRNQVSDKLRQACASVREWVADGAAIYVCGSLEGMAAGVDATLGEILGEDGLEQLIAAGRYRRDVY